MVELQQSRYILPESKQRKTIGILGGMGPAATADFYRRITEATAASKDQDHLHIIINSFPQVPDRTEFLLGSGLDPTPTLISMARTLEDSGADLLVMVCNTAHALLPPLAEAVRVPIVDWISEATRGLMTTHPTLKRLGLLATTGTIHSELYQKAFSAYGVDIITPDPVLQTHIMEIIYGPNGVKARNAQAHASSQSLQHILEYFSMAGAEALLLACTEISLFFTSHYFDYPIPIIDTAQLVAERLILLAGGQLRYPGMPFCDKFATSSR